jgi:hypothetical protein
MTIHNLFVDGFLKSLRKMKPFYIFLHTSYRTIVAVVEELKELDGCPLIIYSDEEAFRVKIKLLGHFSSLIFLCFPQPYLASHSKELACLAVLGKT